MKKKDKDLLFIFVRYLVILLIGLGNLYLFYLMFSPITIFLTKGVLALFSDVFFVGNAFNFRGFSFILANPCIAGAAYYLLFILVMSIGNIDWKKRLWMVLSSFGMLIFLNVSRIVFLVFISSSTYFDIAHWILWYGLSIVFVVGIWFLIVKLFEVKGYPFVDDFSKIIKMKSRRN